MNEKIAQLLAQMAALENDLKSAVHEQESRMFFEIKGKRIEFEKSVKAAHRVAQKSAALAGHRSAAKSDYRPDHLRDDRADADA